MAEEGLPARLPLASSLPGAEVHELDQESPGAGGPTG